MSNIDWNLLIKHNKTFPEKWKSTTHVIKSMHCSYCCWYACMFMVVETLVSYRSGFTILNSKLFRKPMFVFFSFWSWNNSCMTLTPNSILCFLKSLWSPLPPFCWWCITIPYRTVHCVAVYTTSTPTFNCQDKWNCLPPFDIGEPLNGLVQGTLPLNNNSVVCLYQDAALYWSFMGDNTISLRRSPQH